MPSYLLESLDSLSLKQERESIIHKHQFEDAEISHYDLEETTLEKALEDLDTYGLFSTKKVIIIENIVVKMGYRLNVDSISLIKSMIFIE